MKTRNGSKPDTDDGQHRLAVLIDADNAPPAVIEGLLAEVAKYGVASVNRIYGDFTSPQQGQWKKALLKHSIQPLQQFAYTSGKNATDSSLIIDAMDLMYTGRFDGFCLVSSDSDFTRLAQRLREEGLTVYGFGERKTPDAFVQACDKFIYTEVLRATVPAKPVVAAMAAKPAATAAPRPAAAKKAAAAKPASVAGSAPVASSPSVAPSSSGAPAPGDSGKSASEPTAGKSVEPLPLALILQAIEEASDDHGWAFLGTVGSYLNKIRPDFDPRLYGHRKLSDLFKHNPKLFAVEERGSGGTAKTVYVRALLP